MELLQGKYQAHEKGFGFVTIDGEDKDIFIAKKDRKNAMNNDLVAIKILPTKHGQSKEGKIVKILNRDVKQVVGTFQKSRNFGFVVADDKKIPDDIFISKSKWGKAKNNQKVVVEITKYPENGKKAEGKIIEVIGDIDEAGVDMLSIIKQFNLNNEFPSEVIKEAQRVSKEKVELGNRVDYRNKELFTIDGEDAKDLDDAVSVEKNEDGTYKLGVYIADVSHYVKEGSNLNREAILRGTSVYMLDRVIPMLPVELSNGSCSLNQHEDRYSLCVIMKIDSEGKVIDSDVQKCVINVTRRMSYHEVQAIIDRNEKNEIDEDNDNNIEKSKVFWKTAEYKKKVLEETKPYFEHFDRMKELALILKNRRLKNGYLSLDIPETQIVLDKQGIPVEIKPYETTFANEIIEQFMLTANEAVAEKFYWLNAPFIYRVHEKPDEEKVSELNKYLFNFGYKIKGKKDDIKPSAFSQVLEDVKGKEEERVVSNLLLRTLKIAKYEAENRGHFGIASNYYCHFTSPIRRYPDLFIHRVISKYIDDNYNVAETFKEKFASQAEKYATSSSECEQIATKAERESESMKMSEYMEQHIGEEYDGIISSITNFGMFVELPSTIEGLIRFERMGNEYFIYNEQNKTLLGEKTHTLYKLGDKVRIKVIDASKIERRIDFELVNKEERLNDTIEDVEE